MQVGFLYRLMYGKQANVFYFTPAEIHQ